MSTEETTVEFNQRAYAKLQKWLQHLEPVHCRGYSVKALLAKELVMLAYNGKEPALGGFKEVLRQVRYAYDYTDLKKLTDTHRVVITVLHSRPDQRAYAENVKYFINKSEIFYNNLQALPRVVRYSYYYFLHAVKIGLQIPDLTYRMRTHLIVKLLQFLNTLYLLSDLYKNVSLEKKVLVSFNAPDGLDALLTEFFHRRGAKTYSLQHGIYYQYSYFVPRDIINYLFTNTKKVLCWGKGSGLRLTEFYSIPSEKISVTGNARYHIQNRRPIQNSCFKTCLVMLGRFIYNNTNLILLKMLFQLRESLSISFTIRPHPTLINDRNMAIFAEYGFKVSDNVLLINDLSSGNYDFAISSNTGSYLESYFYGIVCLRYESGENETITGLEDKFSEHKSFVSLIDRLKSYPTGVLQTKIDEMLMHELCGNIESYSDI